MNILQLIGAALFSLVLFFGLLAAIFGVGWLFFTFVFDNRPDRGE